MPKKTQTSWPPKPVLSKTNYLVRFLPALVIGFIFACLIIGAWPILHHEITFHVDIARDFMLLNQMVINHRPDLIGPRSSIPGYFHGPLWYYLSLPAFIIAGGDPIKVGWFWILLIAANIYILYFVTSKIFGRHIGYLAAMLYATQTSGFADQLFNPFGSLFLFPLLLYFNYLYLNSRKIIHLLLLFFCYGLTFQFQTAFAAPVMIVNLLYLLPTIFKHKHFKHLLAPFMIVIPLSTFILFDLRHQFLQTRSVWNFIFGPHQNAGLSMTNTLSQRFHNLSFIGLNPSVVTNGWGKYLGLTTLAILIVAALKPKFKYQSFFRLSLMIYLGFWLLVSFYPGEVWQFYYWPFMALGVITTAALIKIWPSKISLGLVLLLISFNFYHTLSIRVVHGVFPGTDPSSWKFNLKLANQIYTDTPGPFGYFVYTPELYAYSPKYAMLYAAKLHPSIQVHPSQKESTTYLIMAAAPEYRPELTGEWWQHQVGITRQPDQLTTYPNGYQVKKYLLSQQEQSVPTDPNLFDTLIFR